MIQKIFLTVLIIISIYFYFKLAKLVSEIGKATNVLHLIGIAFVLGISILINFTLLDRAYNLQKELDAKFPKLEKIENAYKIINN